jgi:hypothetical protein
MNYKLNGNKLKELVIAVQNDFKHIETLIREFLITTDNVVKTEQDIQFITLQQENKAMIYNNILSAYPAYSDEIDNIIKLDIKIKGFTVTGTNVDITTVIKLIVGVNKLIDNEVSITTEIYINETEKYINEPDLEGVAATLEPATLEPASEFVPYEPASEPATLEPATLEPATLEPATLAIAFPRAI